jgi:hypothetical protein
VPSGASLDYLQKMPFTYYYEINTKNADDNGMNQLSCLKAASHWRDECYEDLRCFNGSGNCPVIWGL